VNHKLITVISFLIILINWQDGILTDVFVAEQYKHYDF